MKSFVAKTKINRNFLSNELYWHCTMEGMKKGLLSLLLTPHCRTLSLLWHNHHLSRRRWTLPFSSTTKDVRKYVFIDFGAWSIGAQRTPIMHFSLLLVLAITNTNERDGKPQWDELWWKIFFRFRLEAKKLLVFISFKCKIIIRA